MFTSYRYEFSNLEDQFTVFSAIDCNAETLIEHKVRLNSSSLCHTNAHLVAPILLDMLDLATAIYLADWLSPRSREWKRNIDIYLPLRSPAVFRELAKTEDLQRLLYWYTSDDWLFTFTKRDSTPRMIELAPRLPLIHNSNLEVALWSGGLDSLAGLLKRISLNTERNYTLVGSGSNDHITGKQRIVLEKLLPKFPKERFKLIQLPIEPKYPNDKPKTNPRFRTRGFVFKLIGAVVAILEEQNQLYLYENGFGADIPQ